MYRVFLLALTVLVVACKRGSSVPLSAPSDHRSAVQPQLDASMQTPRVRDLSWTFPLHAPHFRLEHGDLPFSFSVESTSTAKGLIAMSVLGSRYFDVLAPESLSIEVRDALQIDQIRARFTLVASTDSGGPSGSDLKHGIFSNDGARFLIPYESVTFTQRQTISRLKLRRIDVATGTQLDTLLIRESRRPPSQEEGPMGVPAIEAFHSDESSQRLILSLHDNVDVFFEESPRGVQRVTNRERSVRIPQTAASPCAGWQEMDFRRLKWGENVLPVTATWNGMSAHACAQQVRWVRADGRVDHDQLLASEDRTVLTGVGTRALFAVSESSVERIAPAENVARWGILSPTTMFTAHGEKTRGRTVLQDGWGFQVIENASGAITCDHTQLFTSEVWLRAGILRARRLSAGLSQDGSLLVWVMGERPADLTSMKTMLVENRGYVIEPSACRVLSAFDLGHDDVKQVLYSEVTDGFVVRTDTQLKAYQGTTFRSIWSLSAGEIPVTSSVRIEPMWLDGAGARVFLERQTGMDVYAVANGKHLGLYPEAKAEWCDDWPSPRLLVEQHGRLEMIERHVGEQRHMEVDQALRYECRADRVWIKQATGSPSQRWNTQFGRVQMDRRGFWIEPIASPMCPNGDCAPISLSGDGRSVVVSTRDSAWQIVALP